MFAKLSINLLLHNVKKCFPELEYIFKPVPYLVQVYLVFFNVFLPLLLIPATCHFTPLMKTGNVGGLVR